MLQSSPVQRTLPQLIREQARRRPDACAVKYGDCLYTYQELEDCSDRLAQVLAAHKIGPDQVVAVCMSRSLEVVAALYAVVKAGGAYVPLDPTYPVGRLKLMIGDSRAQVLIGDASTPRELMAEAAIFINVNELEDSSVQESRFEIPGALAAEHLAYVIYTSGSTGRPKGVEIPHRAVCNLVCSMQDLLGFGETDSILAASSISFDLSVTEIFLPLVSGGHVVVAPGDIAKDGNAFTALIEECGATWMQGTPTQWQLLLDAGWTGAGNLGIIAGGEEVPAELAAGLSSRVREMWVGYGPTETTVWSTLRRIQPEEMPVLVGGEVANTTLYLVGESGDLVADGDVGELFIGGAGLALGYRFDEGRTGERFLEDIFGDDPDARIYRTGDLFRKRSDGLMEFQGRVDHQVKVRGFRIELGEVETALEAHPDIVQSVAIAAGEGAERSLVAGCRVENGTRPSPGELRSFLRRTLPEYMIPARVAFFERFPLTPNGKTDRKAIAEAAFDSTGTSAQAEAPGTVEAYVQDLVSGLLRVPLVGMTADFFEAGGNSLLAGQVIARVREKYGVSIAWKQFYAASTVESIAAAVKAGQQGAARFPVPAHGDSTRTVYPLSASQERLWFLEKVYPGNSAYTFQCVVRLGGTLDVDALQKALSGILERHAVFRSSFEDRDGKGVQVVQEHTAAQLPVVDISDVGREGQDAHLRRLMLEEIRVPFDLGNDLPVRWVLYRMDNDRHVLLHHEHHLVHDGWSFRVFIGELLELYAAEVNNTEAALAEPVCQFGDFAIAEKAWLSSEEAARQSQFWGDCLRPGLPSIPLPYDRPRPAQQSLKGSSFRSNPPLEVCRAARAFARDEGVTLYTALLAAFHVFLYRTTGEAFLSTGCGVANRKSRESEPLIGMFVNNVVLQYELSLEDNYAGLAHKFFDWSIEAQDNSDVPFDQVVRAVGEEPDLARNPLFQVMFNAHDAPVPNVNLPDLDVRMEEVLANGSAKFDLNVITIPHSQALADLGSGLDPDSISILWEFSSDLFDEDTVRRLAEGYHQILKAALATPRQPIGELPMVDAENRHQILYEWNATKRDYPAAEPVDVLFEQQVARNPDAEALVSGTERVSYRELDRRANALAAILREAGAAGGVVGVLIDRSIEFVVAILGVLKAGGAYLPLVRAHPQERNLHMLKDAGARFLVTRRDDQAFPVGEGIATIVVGDTVAREDQSQRGASTGRNVSSAEPAYMMYTSGSTGRPKGVVVPHRAITRLVCSQEYAPLGKGERVLHLASVGFDASTFEIWGPLLNGGTCVVFDREWPDLEDLEAFIRDQRISVLWLTAALFNQIVDERPAVLQSAKWVIAGGEALSVLHVRRALERFPQLRLVNGYGPTECTTFACTHFIDAKQLESLERIPIGRPIANTTCYILDPRREPVPVGVAGELFIGGDGVALGYVNDVARTEESFVPDPFAESAGNMLYRTGDLCRWRADGTIDFLGRVDEQVKIRGFRIEPGEVSAVLKSHAQVRDSIVVVEEKEPGEKRLVAYVVSAEKDSTRTSDIREHLHQTLPDYLIPAAFVFLDQLPLTENGKLDRRALPAVKEARRDDSPADGGIGMSTTEMMIARIWEDVLSINEVGPEQSFFDLGGHSLAAMRVIGGIEETVGIKLRLSQFFRAPTVRGLAQLIDPGGYGS